MDTKREKLTYKQLQEMLPDYAFGRLDPESKQIFESSIIDYPDLLKELNEIRTVFSKVNEFDFKSFFEQNAKNISVRVQNQLNKTPSKFSFNYFSKIVVPTLGLAAIVVVLIITGIEKDKKKDNFNVQTITKYSLNPYEAMVIFEDLDTLSNEELITSMNKTSLLNPNQDLKEIIKSNDEELYYDLYIQYLSNLIEDDALINILKFSNSQMMHYNIQNILDQIDEEQMQELLEELRNANFS